MEDDFYCDICNAPMKLERKLSSYKNHGSNHRRRRFKCTVCDYTKVIYAGGEMDEKYFPEEGIEEVKNNFKQEEINRLGRPNKIHY
jgi:transposase-like protein